MIAQDLPYAAKRAYGGGRVAAADGFERIANLALPTTTMAEFRKDARGKFVSQHQQRADLQTLLGEWDRGFDDALRIDAAYAAAGAAKGHLRPQLIERVAGQARAVVALLAALDNLPAADQQQILATCSKLAHALDNGLTKLAGGAA
jgi:hypothetical protein